MIECGILTCFYNEPFDKKYGYCKHHEQTGKNIVLKFRAAFNLSQGTIIMTECLNMDLPKEGEE